MAPDPSPRPDRAFALAVVAAYLPVALFAIGYHEMWRDELHCWLVARDARMPWDVIPGRAYDGQPPLWYLLLWVLEKTTHAPFAMQAAHVAIATGVVWFFASRAPFGRVTRGLFAFGYFLAYEYVALSRCYGLALLFALVVCDGHRERFERPLRSSLALAGLALTTTVATLVAVGYAAGLFVERVVRALRGRPAPARGWVPIAMAAVACFAAALCTWPPADSTVAHVGLGHVMVDDAAPSRLIEALVPVPRIDFFFWNSNLLLSWEPFARIAVAAATLAGAWVVFVLSTDVVAGVLFGVSALLLTGLFGFVYPGDVRHHGFFFVAFLMGAWIAASTSTSTSTPDAPPRAPSLRARWLASTLTAVLCAHVAATPVALYYDFKYVFSSGTRAARVLREAGLAHSLLVAEEDYPAIAVIGQLDGVFAYSPRTGRPFSFVRWTRDRRWDPSDEQTLHFAATLGASRGQDATLIMNRPLLPNLVDGVSVRPVAALYDSMIEAENFYIYRVAKAE
jgi:hypothetical protein